MRKILLTFAFVLAVGTVWAQEHEWKAVRMDGSRTGCVTPSKDNVDQAIGIFKGGKYIAPNGTVYRKNSIVGRTAKVVKDAQPKMAKVKEVIAYSTNAMEATFTQPESALSNWFVDLMMKQTEKLAEKKVDIGILNFRGIRVDMPQGDVLLDDMLSMFPFKNQLVYIEQSGKQIRKILENMGSWPLPVLGGVRVVAENGKLVSAEIGGEPIDDDKIYGLSTITFLLGGGDGLALEQDAVSVTTFHDVDVIDAVLEYVYAETAAGRPIEYQTDGRVIVKDLEERR